MRILHLSGDVEDVGGVLSVMRNLHAVTYQHGWKHIVWVNKSYRELRRPALEYRFSKYSVSELPSHFEILTRSIMAFFEMKALVTKEHFDVLHCHTRGTLLSAAALARTLHRPVVFTNHTYARRIGLYQRVSRLKEIYTVTLTPNMARHYGLVEQPPKVNVISACFADALFDQALVPGFSTVTDKSVQLIGVGNVMRWKNWDLLAKAVGELEESERKKIQVSIWGPTPNDGDSPQFEQELRALIAKLQIEKSFRLCGATGEVYKQLLAADWFVLPSTNEPCSVALMEALALGLPALVSASGGNTDIVQAGRTALLFEPGNVKDLARQLRAIISRKVSLAPPAEIRESVKHRSASGVARDYLSLYERILKRT